MKAVLFDMDGVIVDTMDLHWTAAQRSLSNEGLEITKVELKKLDSTKSSEAFAQFFKSKSEQEIEEMIVKKYAWLKKKVKGIKPIPGFFELLFKLKGKYSLGVVSSSRRDFVEYILEEIGEKDSFDVIVGAEDVSKGKPNPECYLKAAKKLNIAPEKCLVIEDSIYGIKSAKSAGMKCVAVTNTYDKNFLLDADLIVDSLKEVSAEKLEGLFNA
ncbi:MAG: HAD family phosphatase [archaeon]|nr:HAD family phosphatase [archaeon]